MPVSKYGELQERIDESVVNGEKEIEVTEDLFNAICKDKNSKSLTVRNDCRIFVAGTREKILRRESISADANYKRSIDETPKKPVDEYDDAG